VTPLFVRFMRNMESKGFAYLSSKGTMFINQSVVKKEETCCFLGE